MCGIVAVFDFDPSRQESLESTISEASKKLTHRGPDGSGIHNSRSGSAILAHERLAIVAPDSGPQPLFNPKGNLVLSINGEIYNHFDLRTLTPNYDFQSELDSEIILALYDQFGAGFLDKLNGIFAFALYDSRSNTYLIARDHMGIIPLYMGRDEEGAFYVASEMKALVDICVSIETFPPGHYIDSRQGLTPKPWYSRSWTTYQSTDFPITEVAQLKAGLEAAVERQLMADIPFGVLLSGGLDSSVIAAITKKHTDRLQMPLPSFAVGLEGAPDLKAAANVASFLGTVHHEVNFTVAEGVEALSQVIYHLETYDVTTVRASTPMFLLAKYIKSLGIKMVLSGEGSDELFGGYLYFHKAPDAQAFHEETVRKLSKLHLYDCLRANKSLAAWGVEGRVPFLDKEFVDIAMGIDPQEKMITASRMEKWLVRKAFEQELPEQIVWRQKEQFSDGVGYSWIDSLKAIAEQKVSDEEFAESAQRFPVNTPKNKEEYWYRTMFESHFPTEAAALTVPSVKSVACSTPEALAWDKSFQEMNDPSGRAVKAVHVEAY